MRVERNPQQQYDDWAEKYDADTASYGWCAPQVLLDAAKEALPPRPGLKVLDIGIGTGQSTTDYLEAGGHITGTDIAAEMLQQARARDNRYSSLVEHDLNQPLSRAGIKPGTQDLVISTGTLHFATNLERTLGEAARALKPGGVLAFTYIAPQGRKFGQSTHLHTPEAVERMLSKLGMELEAPQERFVAYHDKANPEDPVYYQRVVARKPVPLAPEVAAMQRLRGFDGQDSFNA